LSKNIKDAVKSVKTGLKETKERKARHDAWVAAGRPGLDPSKQ
jgi:hypothetical protein